MRYRKLDDKGDMVLGHGEANYLKDSPEAVAQAVLTRLRLLQGEWFLDLLEGTPYDPAVLGKHTQKSYDFAIKSRVLKTQGVTEILEYESLFDGETRKLTVNISLDTIYGQADISEIL